MNTSGHFNEDRTGENLGDRGIVAHVNRAIVAIDSSSPNQTVHDFRSDFSYKTMSFLFLTYLLIES